MTEHEDYESWLSHMKNLVASVICTLVFIGAFGFVLQLPNYNDIEGSAEFWVSILLFILACISALAAVCYAFLSIILPVLVFICSAGVASVNSIDEGGGLRGIVHRIWYGKNDSPD